LMTDNFDPNSLIWIDQRDCQKWALAVYLRGKHAILALPTVVVRRVPNLTPCKLPINVRVLAHLIIGTGPRARCGPHW